MAAISEVLHPNIGNPAALRVARQHAERSTLARPIGKNQALSALSALFGPSEPRSTRSEGVALAWLLERHCFPLKSGARTCHGAVLRHDIKSSVPIVLAVHDFFMNPVAEIGREMARHSP